LNGKVVRLSDYNGKIVILNFFTVWCKYCKQEMPDLNELNMELEKDKAAILLAVDVQEPISTVRSYFAINNLNLNVILDQDGSVTQKYGISGFPTTLIINKDGTLYTYISGRTDKKTLTDILNKINRGEPAQ
jgi:peroxiredoxin